MSSPEGGSRDRASLRALATSRGVGGMPVAAMGGRVAWVHMSSWYYDDGRGNAVGPFDDDQLRDLVRQGAVTMASHVHRAGTTVWVPLSSVAAELGVAATVMPSAVLPPPPGAYS